MPSVISKRISQLFKRIGHLLFLPKPQLMRRGFYPEDIYTAPTDADLVCDLKLGMALGINKDAGTGTDCQDLVIQLL